MGFFDKLKTHFSEVFTRSKLDEDFYDELEEALITADIGVELAGELVEQLHNKIKLDKLSEPEQAKEALRELLIKRMCRGEHCSPAESSPLIVLVIGVNGVGKTTTLGKLAHHYQAQGKHVLLAAGDTFRAAAADQLEIWSKRANVDIVRQSEGADPAAVVFDALNAARARDVDVILIDTAGRLHTKSNLMQELAKIGRVIDREMPDASRECLLVLDATTGQNGLMQAAEFTQSIALTGLVLTKMDGTAKGGVAFAVGETLDVPVKWVGVGEQMGDLMPFDAEAFVREII
ncbi:MAG: signal recognition particle-docking protein FtsY [Oscillospiraceae bacterium]|nr:signal recognition particle-docking protein FtsY [Oscillospiraceae bacterium]